MTNDNLPARDPVRQIAHDAATESVPIDTVPTFDDWSAVVGDVATDIERTIDSEVPA